MGIDIHIWTDKREHLYGDDYDNPKNDYFHKHSLSRTFCNFIYCQDVVNGQPELDQIGQITSVDISPIYQMETYGSDNGDELSFFLETAESDEERQSILARVQQNKEGLKGNTDRIIITIDSLINKLAKIDNLPVLLNDCGHDTLDYKTYFTDFNIDKGEGYIGNNFGQDLRNFRRFLEYAKDKGTSTVYFDYG